jgi:radical SAM superfamily enzyme YgiQ (UPF0313 family)
MKVLLSTSPHVRHPAVLQSDFEPDPSVMFSFAPLGLLSLTATLRVERPDADCELYDLNRRIISGAIPLDDGIYSGAARDICAHTPDVVGFMTECDSYHHVLQIAAQIKALSPQTAVVLGGPHASLVARQTLDRVTGVDAVVIGEGERTFPELLDSLTASTPWAVPGALISVRRDSRNGSARVLDGGPRELIADLDRLPIPAYDLYRPDAGEELFVEAGRGCPFQCTFCSTAPYWNRRHRVKSPQRLLDEVMYVRELFGVTRAHFTHDLFTTDRKWVRRVCRALIDADVPIRWTCSARTDTVDEPLLAEMAEAGCDAIYFGIESGSDRILREIRKQIPLEHSFAMLDACKRAGITPNAGFIVGFPTEDAESARDSFAAYERALRLGCRPTHLFVFCPFAGASIYPQLQELECTGHFVDVPLTEPIASKNRETVANDSDLYGAYFRPKLPGLVPDEPHAVSAMDEFSPLVEATLAPALALARHCGGMYEVFSRWLRWIQARNDKRDTALYRRAYGSPTAFASFLVEHLRAIPAASPAMIAAARAVEVNLGVVAGASSVSATSMAGYRSLSTPSLDGGRDLTLDSVVSADSIRAMLALDYDVTPVLAGEPEPELVAEPTYLVWHQTGQGAVRLLRVGRSVFSALEAIRERPLTVGELLLEQLRADPETASADADALLDSLAEATREGLLTT